MRRFLLVLMTTALLLLGALPAMASQFGGHSPISTCSRC